MKLEGMREVQPIMPAMPTSKETGGNPVKGPATAVEKPKDFSEEQKEPKANDTVAEEKAIELINQTMQSYNTELHFTLHKSSGEYVVKIINTKDQTVIREIPPERVLDMVAHFKKVLGLLVDKFI